MVVPETGDGPQMMSAQEIADLTGKTLSNVNRDIRAMANAIHGDHSNLNDPAAPAIPGIVVERDNRGYVSAIRLDRDHTMTVVTGYDVALRHKIMKRWSELERAVAAADAPAFRVPTTLREALLLAAAQEEEIERHRAVAEVATARAIETERTKAEIGSKREATAMATASAAAREARKLKIQLDRSNEYATVKRMEIAFGRKFPWHPLKKTSLAMGLAIEIVDDPNFNTVKSYHATVWREVYGVDVPGHAGSSTDGEAA